MRRIVAAFVLGFVFSSPPSWTQGVPQQAQAVVISEKVGVLIDAEERNRYRLFPDVSGFRHAQIVLLPDGTYELRVVHVVAKDERLLTRRISLNDLERIRQHISNEEQVSYFLPYLRLMDLGEKPRLVAIPGLQAPEPSTGRIVGEMFGGVGGALVGGFLGGIIALIAFPISEENDEENSIEVEGDPGVEPFGRAIGEFFATMSRFGPGFVVGSMIGSATAVHAIGSTSEVKGSYWATLGGSIFGTVLGGGLVYIMRDSPPLAAIAFLTCQSGGATIGFNSTRKLRKPALKQGVLNIERGKFGLASPGISLRPDPYGRGTLIYSIDLISVHF